jgi:hypothetical protein
MVLIDKMRNGMLFCESCHADSRVGNNMVKRDDFHYSIFFAPCRMAEIAPGTCPLWVITNAE